LRVALRPSPGQPRRLDLHHCAPAGRRPGALQSAVR
jgi:hypothetical protein